MNIRVEKAVTMVKMISPVLLHSAVTALIRPLKPESLSQRKLAATLALPHKALNEYRWEGVHQGTTSRTRLYIPVRDEVLFVKSSPPDFATRLFGAMFRLSINEIGFYRDLATETTVSVPACRGYFGNRYRYLLLLEDLDGKASFSNSTTRCDVERAASVIRTLARLHADFWLDPRFDDKWRWINRQEYKRNHSFSKMLRARSAVVAVQKYAELLPENIPGIAKKISKAYSQLEEIWSKGARTLVHGDAHIGNMYFLPDGTTGLLDWQVLGYEQGMRDVTYFLINSVPGEVRLDHQKELIQLYVNSLDRLGVTIDFELAWQQYRAHAAYVWVSAAVTASSSTMQEKKIAAAGLVRTSRALLDLDVEELLDQLL